MKRSSCCPSARSHTRARLHVEALEDRSLPSCNLISGYVYHDANNNGLYDMAAETPIANSNLELRNDQGVVVARATSDGNGYYEFSTDSTIDTSPKELSYSASFPSTLTDFDLTGAVPQFDPNLGQLQSVQIIHSGSITTDIRAENTSDVSAAVITGTVSGQLRLTGPGVELTNTPSRNAGTFRADVYDGHTDFGGGSGMSFGARTANSTRTADLTGAAMDPFIGPGEVMFHESATATSTASGGGNVVVAVNSRAAATAQVIYRYVPSNCLLDGNYTIVQAPEPAGYIDGKESRNGTVLDNPANVSVIPVTLAGQDLVHNDFGELLPQISAPPAPPPGPAPQGDLAIVKTASAPTVLVGSPLSYTLTVSNLGPNDAAGVTVRDQLPGGVTFVSTAGAGWQISQAQGIITATRDTLAVGATSVITVNLVAPGNPDTILNTGTVTSNTPDSNPNNNTSTVAVNVIAPGQPPPPPPATGISQEVFADVPASFPSTPMLLGKADLFSDSGTDLNDPQRRAQVTWVEGLYRTLLGREADPAGLLYWVRQVSSGVSRVDIARAFWTSEGHRAMQIQALYRNLLDRDAPPDAYAYWTGIFQSGASETDVTTLFLTSPEYLSRYPDSAGYINSLYQRVLGRSADPGAQVYWQGVLSSRGREAVVRGILGSDEANLRGIELVFNRFLGRGLNGAERQWWLSQFHRGLSLNDACLLVLSSGEMWNAAVRAAA
ncbi:MAG: choice-of-anchor E domain-containing protein [Gemmataceae bacterium]|nr:choice-of-anchor E domain-containing protein [Gemmataceae bacterium]